LILSNSGDSRLVAALNRKVHGTFTDSKHDPSDQLDHVNYSIGESGGIHPKKMTFSINLVKMRISRELHFTGIREIGATRTTQIE
jgi:hypothetical protein